MREHSRKAGKRGKITMHFLRKSCLNGQFISYRNCLLVIFATSMHSYHENIEWNTDFFSLLLLLLFRRVCIVNCEKFSPSLI